MYNNYVSVNHMFEDDEEWKTNCYGDIPNMIPKMETVESVFVTNARKITTARKAVWYVLSGMIFAVLWIIAQKGRTGK